MKWVANQHDDDRCDYCYRRAVEITDGGLFLCKSHLDEYNKEIVQATLESFT